MPQQPDQLASNLTWNQPPKHQFQSPQQRSPPSASAPYTRVYQCLTWPTQPPAPPHILSQTETLEDVLKTQTGGLVHLSEFTKRRVEPWDHDAAEKLLLIRSSGGGGGGPASTSREGSEGPTGSWRKRSKKRKKLVKGKLSFAGV